MNRLASDLNCRAHELLKLIEHNPNNRLTAGYEALCSVALSVERMLRKYPGLNALEKRGNYLHELLCQNIEKWKADTRSSAE